MVTTTAVSNPPPPLSPYGTFHGSLFQYHKNLVAFESSPPPSSFSTSSNHNNHNNHNNNTCVCCPKKCIFVGGLSDGLLPTPYTASLQEACHDIGWSLVQPLMSSSYTGFGHGSLERDSQELHHLLDYLITHRSATHFGFVGHSTGCQNAIHLLKHLEDGSDDDGDGDDGGATPSSNSNSKENLVSKIQVVALQAPVSDREGAMVEPQYAENIQTAREIVAHHHHNNNQEEEEMMPRSAFWAPITAQRFLDLQDKGGADDFFSSDYTDMELQERLGHVGQQTYESTGLQVLVAFSGADEYVPSTVHTKHLTQRLCDAMNVHCVHRPVATSLYLPTANHNLSQGEGDATTFVAKVKELLHHTTTVS